ncbi:hypothetical protein [Clostridium fungisolvens]|uniref:Uncharacterized protein n=1 Tax=Clostridium fungisolvens TaxID=1604897 RepID=A0A6V8SF95_9CLOT|nr:hypothetical protein [Clostridium fungisolvens]GFP75135.1 hypothetical protein bsdtw1_01206 [Clostridium fungisolvens]
MKKRTKSISIVFPIVLLIMAYYIFFMRIDKYTYNRDTNTIEKDGIEYVRSNSLPSEFLDKENKTIGKIKGSDSESAERWVIKIKDIDEHEMFLVTGIMNQELFIRADKVAEFNKTLLK